jgi:AcrR family transcriptional regulator
VPRPKGYAEDDVLEAATQIFWARGYHGAGLSDLEEATGLNRSSIYHVFGSKKQFFAAVLETYATDFVDPLLAGIEHRKPGLRAISAFFISLADYFSANRTTARNGCLLVNTLYEFPGGKDLPPGAAALPGRLRAAFRRCLEAAAKEKLIPRSSIERRAEVLESATIGVWLAARADPNVAGKHARAVATEVASWRVRRKT